MTETPEERSKQTFDAWYQEDIQGSNQVPETLIATYALAIREAEERGRVAGMRERCAAVADAGRQGYCSDSATTMAKEIIDQYIAPDTAPFFAAWEEIAIAITAATREAESRGRVQEREAEERGRVQEREACADAVGFSNSASAAIRARSTASPTTAESQGQTAESG